MTSPDKVEKINEILASDTPTAEKINALVEVDPELLAPGVMSKIRHILNRNDVVVLRGQERLTYRGSEDYGN